MKRLLVITLAKPLRVAQVQAVIGCTVTDDGKTITAAFRTRLDNGWRWQYDAKSSDNLLARNHSGKALTIEAPALPAVTKIESNDARLRRALC
jgi:hypothetical protein